MVRGDFQLHAVNVDHNLILVLLRRRRKGTGSDWESKRKCQDP